MAVGIYKKGQGYWTRLMSAVALGTLTLMGCVWLWDEARAIRIGEIEPVYISAAAATIFAVVIGLLGFTLLARKPKVVDFMIATEGEMKKVNWSSRKEIMGSTWVVIGLTIFIAILCATFDLAFQAIFKLVGVLEA